ncbi:Hsp90 cochaperone SBA1 LALA0_S02e03224g [Lachancea lanzarotensis]|uniref:LALA0S02e03224g1_1 n=1 Tax=Lachancea lanzarotensis TaxID=1245769 RepID=A0A0C7MU35_9SACH|nr:uncharacterized protein LALA0_S02e03224g [Lachancea lanzarotensis]CEP60944.1 LALA0S02e03224g1_1 [Lachancea lanzarotensis]
MSKSLTPEVLWAQRSSETEQERNFLLVTIMIPDCEQPKLDLKATHLEFTAHSPGHVGDEEEHKYKLHIDFFKEIDVEKSQSRVANGRDYFLKLYKKDLDAEYWPRLTKEKLKYHFIKTDFNKWVDEDEQEDQKDEDLGFDGGLPGGQDGAQAAAFQELLKNGGAQGLEGLEALQGLGGMGGGAAPAS